MPTEQAERGWESASYGKWRVGLTLLSLIYILWCRVSLRVFNECSKSISAYSMNPLIIINCIFFNSPCGKWKRRVQRIISSPKEAQDLSKSVFKTKESQTQHEWTWWVPVIENEDLNDEYPESAPCLIM